MEKRLETPPFLETIKLLNGKFYQLDLHEARIRRTQNILFPTLNQQGFSLPKAILEKLTQKAISLPTKGLYRCRILYRETIELIEFIPYTRREIRSLKLIESDLDYRFKSSDRTELNRLFNLREECDDILIVKNGYITDTTIANIALLHTETNIWHTPETPLLRGTKREALISTGKITLKKITPEDLEQEQYTKIALFNAMIDFGEIILSTKNIVK